ncbi:hypothetical protein GOODEAATRI_020816, partial [Goodea atripinnis]
AESSNTELSLQLNKLLSEDAALRDSLAKMGSMNEDLAQDKVDLNNYILQLEEEKSLWLAQKRQAEQEKLTIRDELVRLEQDRLELESGRILLQQALQDAEQSRAGMETELQSLRAERLKLQERVGLVASLGSELSLAQGEAQKNEVALEEAGRGRAELARDKAALVVQLTASERENSVLSEELAAFRSERESLETSLFEVQQQLAQVESRRDQLETENQTLRVRCETAIDGENTLAQAEREKQTLTQALNAAQLEAQQALRKAVSEHQEDVERLISEKALSLKEVEKAVLSDRVSSLQAELSAAALEAERMAREAAHHKEQEQIRVGALTGEMLELRSQLDEATSAHQRELNGLQELCSDLRSRSDMALKELEQCRASLSAAEESRDQVRRDLLEADCRLSQAQEASENYRREMMELRRNLSDVTKERDALSQSNTQLRGAVRSSETERISVKRQCEEKEQRLAVLEENLSSSQKEVTELRSCLREVERSRLEARRELQELRRQRRLMESESGWRSCERDLTAQLQEARGCEKKLQDEVKNLSLRAQAAHDAAAQSGLQLSEAQGRLAATEAELTRAEAARRDLEFRLNNLQSALTRTLGIGATEFRGSTPDNTLGSGAVSPERCDTPLPQSELDPDFLRSGLRDFLQELRDAQREKDQLNKQRAAEARVESERKRLREALEAAEARATRVELGRRSLEGELQRLKLSLGDREAESQASQQRHDTLMKQVCYKVLHV